MSSGRWSGTIRMSRRAWASAGVTVFGVVAVCPAHSPWRLRVVSNVSASIAARPSRPPMSCSMPASLRTSSRKPGSCRAMTASCTGVGGRLPTSRPGIAGRPSASQNVASAATSRWPAFGSTTLALECESTSIVRRCSSITTIPLPPPSMNGRPARSSAPPSIRAASASRSPGRRSSKCVERVAPGLLLALDQVADAARQRADRLEPGLDGPDPRQELALVVGRTAGPHAAVADRGLVGRRRPQLEGTRGLHVVVLDRGHRPRPVTDLA